VLEDTDRYRFTIDKEAERQLPKIIRNTVQVVWGKARSPGMRPRLLQAAPSGLCWATQPRRSQRHRRAVRRHTGQPETRLFGFWWPRRVVENEAIEVTRELVDAYRNLAGLP
jgi:pyrophosphate--fructose-6-phosphate 1-phosphotransferase